MGRGSVLESSFRCKDFCAFARIAPPPTSVGFAAHAADGLRAAKWPCSPKTSLIAHANDEYTHGRVLTGKGRGCP